MKPFAESAAFSRPNLSDSFGQIQLDRRIQASVSDGLFLKAQRLARMNEVSMADWVRGIVEREVMASILPEHPIDFRTINGVGCVVHDVKAKRK